MIGCWCDEAFVEKIDRARGTHTRSQFCREAIAEKLRTLGIAVPEHEATSPDRVGKGGPRRMIYRVTRHQAALNESSPQPPARKRPKKPGQGSD